MSIWHLYFLLYSTVGDGTTRPSAMQNISTVLIYSKLAFIFVTLTLYKWTGGPGMRDWAQAHGTLLPC